MHLRSKRILTFQYFLMIILPTYPLKFCGRQVGQELSTDSTLIQNVYSEEYHDWTPMRRIVSCILGIKIKELSQSLPRCRTITMLSPKPFFIASENTSQRVLLCLNFNAASHVHSNAASDQSEAAGNPWKKLLALCEPNMIRICKAVLAYIDLVSSTSVSVAASITSRSACRCDNTAKQTLCCNILWVL